MTGGSFSLQHQEQQHLPYRNSAQSRACINSAMLSTYKLDAVHEAARAAVPDTEAVVNGNADDMTRCERDIGDGR